MSRRGLLRVVARPMMVPALLAGLMMAQTVPAHAEGTSSMTTPYGPVTYTNGCLSTEIFEAAGFIHKIIHFNMNSADQMHLYSLDNTHDVKSIFPAASGSTYVVSQTDNFILDVTPSLNTVIDFGVPERLNVISQGPAPNF